MGFDEGTIFITKELTSCNCGFKSFPDLRLLTKQTFFYNFSIVGGQKVKKVKKAAVHPF